jgi:hypothetical protein
MIRRHITNLATVGFLLAALGPAAHALTIHSVKVPQTITLHKVRLRLNGAGVRNYTLIFSFGVYVGALYLEHPTHQAGRALAEKGPDRVAMYFLRSVSRSELRSAWREGFRRNNSNSVQTRLAHEIASFIAVWKPLHDHDRVFLDYVPSHGTTVSLNGAVIGHFPGQRFHEALLRIWLGPRPPTHDLKRRMLGR